MSRAPLLTVLVLLVATVEAMAIGCGTGSDVPVADDRATTGPDGSPGAEGGALSDAGSAEVAPADACKDASCGIPPCEAGKETSIAGVVHAPNGVTPIYNAIVYIPTAPVAPFAPGMQCDPCGLVPSGAPIATTLTAPDGSFVLRDVPPGKDVPLVVQIGKWRRQAIVPSVSRCATTTVLADDVRLPRRQSEGEMPHIALTSGCDPVGCALRKIGIDMSELGTSANPTRAVHVFDGSPWVGGGAWPKAQILWKDPSLMKTYDQVIFSGECLPMLDTKGAPGQEAFQVVTEYLASGGRILTTGSMFNWYKLSSDPLLASVAVIPGPGGATQGGEQAIAIDSGFPKGKALAEWLFNLYPTMVKGKPTGFSWVYDNISSVDGAKAQVWGVGPGGTKPRIFSVNTPVGKPVATQCGKAVHVDAHVSVDTSMDASFTTSPLACNGPMDARFAVVAFFLFDNVACIQKEGDAPVSPPTK